MKRIRRVTLYGTLHGPIWQPGPDCQLPIEVDLITSNARDVSRSGLVAAVKAAVDSAGDFRSARLTADSFILFEHRQVGPPAWAQGGSTVRSWARRVDVIDLPSLSEYVAADQYQYADDR
jgi:hypothetical protein